MTSHFLWDSRRFELRKVDFVYFNSRRPYILLEPGSLYTNRKDMSPVINTMDTSQTKLATEDRDFWTKGFGLTHPLMFVGETFDETYPAGSYFLKRYPVFLCAGHKILIEHPDLWMIKRLQKYSKR